MATQLDILLPEAEAHDALHYWADSVGESRGEIFTKTAVVEFILDLTGWRIGEDLLNKRLLEPSCGSGDFLVPAVRRLLADSPGASAGELLPCIRAVEVNQVAYAPGEYYPHHNLYYLTSATWDLRALRPSSGAIWPTLSSPPTRGINAELQRKLPDERPVSTSSMT